MVDAGKAPKSEVVYAVQSELADLLGVKRQWAGQLTLRPGFPAPAARSINSDPIWIAEEIVEWNDQRNRHAGRPSKGDADAAGQTAPEARKPQLIFALQSEMPDVLGVIRSWATELTLKPSFPVPAARTVGNAPLWDPAEIKRWNKQRPRRLGRPAKKRKKGKS